jgi:RNA polymerase sigma factor (sigma-70 family)
MGKQLNDIELWNEYISSGRPVQLRNKLAENNLKLIYEVIAKTKRTTPALLKEDVDDLFQQGFFGLNSAIERFEMEEGRYFYAFAFPFIYGRLMSWIRDKSRMVRIPVVKHDIIMRSFRIKEKLQAKGINEPTMREVFELVPDEDKQIGFDKWKEIITTWHRTKTYSVDDRKSAEGDDGSMLELIPSKEYPNAKIDKVNVGNDEPWNKYPELLGIYVRLSRMRCFIQEERRSGKPGGVVHFSLE